MIGTMGTVPFDFAQSHLIEVLGFAASGATLCAFAQKQMLPMRISAIAANLFFIGYGAFGVIYPVLLLHLILLPLNIGRLVEQVAQRRRAAGVHRAPRLPLPPARRFSHYRLPHARVPAMAGQIRRGSVAP